MNQELPHQPSAMPMPLLDVPPAPRTPSARAKRLIFKFQGQQWAMLLLGIIFTLIGTPVLLLFGNYVYGDLAVAVAGKKTQGVVGEKRVLHHITINEDHPKEIDFTFERDGQPRKGSSATTDYELADTFREGDTVDVEYVGDLARIRGTTYSPGGYLALIPLLFPTVGVLMLFFAIRSNRRETAAFRHGVLAFGSITYAGPDTSTEINGRHPFEVRWEFDVEGKRFKGSLSTMQESELAEFAVVGREVAVLHLAEDPRSNTLYVD